MPEILYLRPAIVDIVCHLWHYNNLLIHADVPLETN